MPPLLALQPLALLWSLGIRDFLPCCLAAPALMLLSLAKLVKGTWSVLLSLCKCPQKEARGSLMVNRDQDKLFCHLKQSAVYIQVDASTGFLEMCLSQGTKGLIKASSLGRGC